MVHGQKNFFIVTVWNEIQLSFYDHSVEISVLLSSVTTIIISFSWFLIEPPSHVHTKFIPHISTCCQECKIFLFSVSEYLWMACMCIYKSHKSMYWLMELYDITGNVPRDKISIETYLDYISFADSRLGRLLIGGHVFFGFESVCTPCNPMPTAVWKLWISSSHSFSFVSSFANWRI